MKLKTLTIHNLASIEDATIDFANGLLAGQDLFLICGPTGSGKTTILDAICLALFNTTPRIEGSSTDIVDNMVDGDGEKKEKIKDVSHLVRKNAVEASVRLVFEGSDNREYITNWHYFRKGQYRTRTKKIIKDGVETEIRERYEASTFTEASLEEKLKFGFTKEWTLTDEEGIDTRVGVAEKIVEVIKMDFKQFCKTTMLAQGDFTKFLSSSADDKAQILEKLVGTEKYAEVGKVINQTANKKKNEVEARMMELDNFHFLSDEERETKQQEIARLKTENKAIDAQKADIDKKVQWLSDLERAQRNLVQNRTFITENTPKLEIFAAQLDALNKEKTSLTAQKDEAMSEIARFEKIIETHKTELKEKGAETIVYEIKELYNHINQVKDAETALRLRDEAQMELQSKHEATKAAVKAYAEAVETELTKRQMWEVAAAELKASRELYDKTKESISNHAKVLRAKLKVGDDCPVCGRKIEQVLSDDGFLSALKPLEEKYLSDEKKELALQREYLLAKANLSVLKNAASTTAREEETIKRKFDSNQQSLLQLCASLGIESGSVGLEIFAEMKRAYDEKNRVIAQRQKEIDAIREKMDKVNVDISAIRRQRIALIDGKLLEMQRNVERFLGEKASLTGRIAAAQAQVELLQKEIAGLANSANKPLENETAESLDSGRRALSQKIQENQQTIGSLNNELETDNQNRLKQGKKKAELDALREDFAEWKRLDQYLGSTDGKLFRNIAQSFILSDLLEKANAYLANISGRYTLFCNPGTLTIMMRDAYQGDVVRPTNTLSGGESFVISLSLALGLSSMQSSGFDVDTLFIDEGFGTLSPELLDPVIASLRRLYHTYGRRVGIISHVEALRSRIPATIEVTKSGNSSSRVEVKLS